MSNDLELSQRRQMLTEAKQHLQALQQAPLAGGVEAAKAMNLLLASYPQSPGSNLDLYMRQVTILLANTPLVAVHAMVDPVGGIIARHAFLPAIAEIHRWLDERQAGTRTKIRQLRAVIDTLKDDGPTPPPKHIRERQLAELEAKRGQSTDERKAALDAKMDARFAKQQCRVPELSMQALKNLDGMIPGSKE